jgi:DNA-binding response OmpR family regulator
MLITIVEDDQDLLSELTFLLQYGGHQVTALSTASEFYRYRENTDDIDILLLDLGLPDEDGLVLAKKLKEGQLQGVKGMGIVMFTGRDSLAERLVGLAAGADAYLIKPVDIRELMAVIEGIHRRIKVEHSNSDGRNETRTTIAQHWQLAPGKRRLYKPDGGLINLTAAEGTILNSLTEGAPDPVSRQQLAESLGQDYWHYDERKLEAIVSRLRRKLQGANDQRNNIKAARGRGYQLLINIITSQTIAG